MPWEAFTKTVLKTTRVENRELKPDVLPDIYARKLAIVEVRDCAQLEHILSATTTSEISMNGEGYDFHCLKKLDIQRLPRLQALLVEETTTSGQTYQPLFHEKMNFPSLEELYLSSLDSIEELWESSSSDSASAKETFSKLHMLTLDKMPRLKHVWSKELCDGSLSFGSLKKINIVDCALLESLCPPTIPVALLELDSMEITLCDNLKEVIMKEPKGDTIIEFPLLRSLKLDKLSSLRCFCQGSYTIKFPSLKVMLLSSLPKMLTFIEPKNSDTLKKRTPFIEEIVFPSLEHLEISAMDDIEELVDEEHAAIAFPKLKALSISALGNLKFIPETILNQLDQLRAHRCDSLDGLFEVKSTACILSLRKLELVEVRCLKPFPWTLLPNLHSLVIHKSLLGVKSIISSTSIVQGNVLQHLEYLNIEECEHLEEIVSKECDLKLDLLGTYMFPQLKHIKLHNLPNVATFSSWSYEAMFRALEKVDISSCPSLVSFTSGILTTPKLKSLQVDQELILEHVDLNRFLQCKKQGCSKLEEGSKQGKELSQPTLQQTVSVNEANNIVRLYENSQIAASKALITNNASSKQSNCSISV